MIVADASSMFELVVRTSAGRAVRKRIGRGQTVHVPHLLDVEVLHALRSALRRGAINRLQAARALRRLTSLRMTKYPHGPLLRRAWELRDNVSAYDAAYVALAERLDVPLLTRDARLAGAPGVRARIEILQPVD